MAGEKWTGRVPRGYRTEPIRGFSYVDAPGPDYATILNLAAGQAHKGFPDELPGIVEEFAEELRHKGSGYKKENTKLAVDGHNRRFGFTGKAYTRFINGGSIAAMREALRALPPPPRKSQVNALGPSFPFNYIFTQEYALGPESPRHMVFSRIEPPLGISQEEALEYAIKSRKKIKLRRPMLNIITDPNTYGDSAPLKAKREYAEFCADIGDGVLFDMATGDAIPNHESAFILAEELPNVMGISSFSKLGGLAMARVGIISTSPEFREVAESFQIPYGLTDYQQFIVNRLYNPEVYDRHLAETRKQTAINKAILLDMLREYGVKVWPTAEATPIIMVEAGPNLYEVLIKKYELQVVPGSGYYDTHHGMNNSVVRANVPDNIQDIELLAKALSAGSRTSYSF